jgi:hypothetical protein
MSGVPEPAATLSSSEVRHLCGDLLDSTVAAVIATGATAEDVEAAAAWLEGQDDSLREARHALTGAAAAVYDVLARGDDFYADEDAARR